MVAENAKFTRAKFAKAKAHCKYLACQFPVSRLAPRQYRVLDVALANSAFSAVNPLKTWLACRRKGGAARKNLWCVSKNPCARGPRLLYLMSAASLQRGCFGAIVYRLGLQIFILARGVRLPLALFSRFSGADFNPWFAGCCRCENCGFSFICYFSRSRRDCMTMRRSHFSPEASSLYP